MAMEAALELELNMMMAVSAMEEGDALFCSVGEENLDSYVGWWHGEA